MSSKGKHWKLSADTRKKLSDSKKEFLNNHPERKKPFYDWSGKKHKKETIEKMAKNSPRKKHTEESKRKLRIAHIGIKASEETKAKMGQSRLKERNPNWRGGISNGEYSIEFNKTLKESIKAGDRKVCQLCNNEDTQLHIHHIDYVKSNSSERNLIALCDKCHGMTNGSREFWTGYFKDLQNFKYILEEIFELKKRKSLDYGNSYKIGGLDGIIGQINNKIIRLWNLQSNETYPANEPIKDTYKDLAIYCLMALELIESGNTEPDEKEMSKLFRKRFNRNLLEMQ
jgi:5-methylcytosine-specific restriction endonuclease McrA